MVRHILQPLGGKIHQISLFILNHRRGRATGIWFRMGVPLPIIPVLSVTSSLFLRDVFCGYFCKFMQKAENRRQVQQKQIREKYASGHAQRARHINAVHGIIGPASVPESSMHPGRISGAIFLSRNMGAIKRSVRTWNTGEEQFTMLVA